MHERALKNHEYEKSLVVIVMLRARRGNEMNMTLGLVGSKLIEG